MNIEKVDKIILTTKDIDKVNKWLSEQSLDSINLPLTEAFVIIKDLSGYGIVADMGNYFYLDEKTGDITLKIFDMKDMFMLVSATIDEQFFQNGTIKINSRFHNYTDEMAQNSAKATIRLVLDVFQYMTHRTEHVVLKEETKQYKKSSKNKKKSNNNKSRYVKIKTSRYTLDFEKEVNTDPRGYERHTDAWTVRGHWRYYKKSGKRVWIKGHVRGQGETEGKIYKV